VGPTGSPKPNLSTLIPKALAAKKCPASCTSIKKLKSKIIIISDITAPNIFKIYSQYYLNC
jgi:hypothetical protein